MEMAVTIAVGVFLFILAIGASVAAGIVLLAFAMRIWDTF